MASHTKPSVIETHKRWLSAVERMTEMSVASRDLVALALLSSCDESLSTATMSCDNTGQQLFTNSQFTSDVGKHCHQGLCRT